MKLQDFLPCWVKKDASGTETFYMKMKLSDLRFYGARCEYTWAGEYVELVHNPNFDDATLWSGRDRLACLSDYLCRVPKQSPAIEGLTWTQGCSDQLFKVGLQTGFSDVQFYPAAFELEILKCEFDVVGSDGSVKSLKSISVSDLRLESDGGFAYSSNYDTLSLWFSHGLSCIDNKLRLNNTNRICCRSASYGTLPQIDGVTWMRKKFVRFGNIWQSNERFHVEPLGELRRIS